MIEILQKITSRQDDLDFGFKSKGSLIYEFLLRTPNSVPESWLCLWPVRFPG